MGETFIMNLGRESLLMVMMLSAPFLITSLVVGIIISILQAVTQIQDMTITFVPKFILLGVVLLATGGWMMSIMHDFTVRIIQNIALFTR
jgi:flagellar biosynthetic protein FliQ